MCKNCNNALSGIIYLSQTETTSFVPSFLCFLIIKKNVGRETLLIPDHYHYYVISLDTEKNRTRKWKMKTMIKCATKIHKELHANLGEFWAKSFSTVRYCHVENCTRLVQRVHKISALGWVPRSGTSLHQGWSLRSAHLNSTRSSPRKVFRTWSPTHADACIDPLTSHNHDERLENPSRCLTTLGKFSFFSFSGSRAFADA